MSDRPPSVTSIGSLSATRHDGQTLVVPFLRKSLGRPDEVRAFANGRIEVFNVGDTVIVDSTPKVAALGNAAWRGLLAEHNVRARFEIDRFRGQEVGTTGDGLLVVFESPAAAVPCCAAMAAVATSLGLAIRAGAHSG